MQKELSPEAYDYLLLGMEKKRTERRNAAKVMRRFAKSLKAKSPFQKGTFFSREGEYVLRFIHVHKFSFGPCFRIHACIRILNDPMKFLHLNGIHSTDQFVYDESGATLLTCTERMLRFVADVAEPWFEAQTPEALIRSDSALSEEARQALQSALSGIVDENRAQLSRSLLGRVGMSEIGV